ncbi:MAG: ribosomal RNA small subunit methyltransferase I [bacterium]
MSGKLSIVATPIGNLEDITLRALRVLKECDVVACEDTRVTKKLLSHYNIHTPVTSFHANSGAKGFEKILAVLKEGKHVALVSDAGTPGISDPGLELVSIVRELSQNLPSEKVLGSPRPPAGGLRPDRFLQEDFAPVKIETIPGASALAAALAIAGMRANSFTFYGFLPIKKGRETLFKEIASSERASVFYESPHRILKTLDSLEKYIGLPYVDEKKAKKERRVGIFRELTKLFEESIVGSASEVKAMLESDKNKQRGEFVVIVEGE